MALSQGFTMPTRPPPPIGTDRSRAHCCSYSPYPYDCFTLIACYHYFPSVHVNCSICSACCRVRSMHLNAYFPWLFLRISHSEAVRGLSGCFIRLARPEWCDRLQLRPCVFHLATRRLR